MTKESDMNNTSNKKKDLRPKLVLVKKVKKEEKKEKREMKENTKVESSAKLNSTTISNNDNDNDKNKNKNKSNMGLMHLLSLDD